MKTMRMLSDHLYKPKRTVSVEYKAGRVYERVPEAAVRSILDARAGEVVVEGAVDGGPGQA